MNNWLVGGVGVNGDGARVDEWVGGLSLGE